MRRNTIVEIATIANANRASFIGHHAGASSLTGVAAHTWMSSRISDVKFNGVSASEGYINAVLAGEFVVLDITFHFRRPAELLSRLPIVERSGAPSIRYRANSVADAVRFSRIQLVL